MVRFVGSRVASGLVDWVLVPHLSYSGWSTWPLVPCMVKGLKTWDLPALANPRDGSEFCPSINIAILPSEPPSAGHPLCRVHPVRLFLCKLWTCLSIVPFTNEETEAICPQRGRSVGCLLVKHPLPRMPHSNLTNTPRCSRQVNIQRGRVTQPRSHSKRGWRKEK